MSSHGYPDWQRYSVWLGTPLVQATALAIGAGSHTDGPFQVSNYASIILAIKPTGGQITATIKQTVQGGPTSLILSQQFVIPAGATAFEAVVLLGSTLTLDLQGSAGGETVDYALYPSNTTTNAQVITAATVDVQHQGVLVAAEPAIDLVDGLGITWTVADDGPGRRVLATPNLVPIADTTLTVAAGAIDLQSIPATFKHLRLVCYLRSTDGGVAVNTLVRLNNDGAANYDFQYISASAAAAVGAEGLGQTSVSIGGMPAAGGGANLFSQAMVELADYTNATNNKSVLSDVIYKYGILSGNMTRYASGGFWRSNAAVNRLTILPSAGNLAIGSRVTLYGWA